MVCVLYKVDTESSRYGGETQQHTAVDFIRVVDFLRK
jgi:hypothetical protein